MRSPEEHAVATAIITLMRGVVYREHHEAAWATIDRQHAGVRDHFEGIGVDVVIDETEGYAYLRTRATDDGEEELPRLVKRRSLTYPVSLLLVLLRKRLAEFEATSSETKLVLTRDQIVELVRVYLPDSTNQARLVDQIDSSIKRTVEMGFLRQLRNQTDRWEVRRVLKAYVDAETLSDFAARLEEYAASGAATRESVE